MTDLPLNFNNNDSLEKSKIENLSRSAYELSYPWVSHNIQSFSWWNYQLRKLLLYCITYFYTRVPCSLYGHGYRYVRCTLQLAEFGNPRSCFVRLESGDPYRLHFGALNARPLILARGIRISERPSQNPFEGAFDL